MKIRTDGRRRSRAGVLRPRLAALGSAAVVLLLAVPAAASADVTLGTTVQPAGTTSGACGGDVIGQLTSDPSTQYMVPAGGGQITGWQTNTTGATAGAPLTFLVLAPLGGNTYSVVGADNENLPNPLPANNLASYTLPTPIVVSGGDTLGLYAPSGTGGACYWWNGSTPQGDSLIALATAAAPNAGQTLGEITSGTPTSGGGFTLNLTATLVDAEDVGVATSTLPVSASVGKPALLAATVSNAGPGSAPVTFTYYVPAGLQVDSVASSSGSCATSGQLVTCTLTGLAPGQSAPVNLEVTPSAAGVYASAVSVVPTDGVNDPNPANNVAAAVLDVTAPTTSAAAPTTSAAASLSAKCVVPPLKGIPAAFARRVLGLLGCTIGKVKMVHSHLAKGAVIATSPRAGTFAAGHVVALQVSSGPKRGRK